MSAAVLANLFLAQFLESPKRCLRWGYKYWNQVALWMVTWLWSNWAIMSLFVHKTRGIFLQGCSSFRQRRETSCKLILYFRSWQNKEFVGQLVLLTEKCRKCTMQKFTSSQIPSYVWEKERWTNQKSSSPKNGMSISSITGNLQGELMEKIFSSYSSYFVP